MLGLDNFLKRIHDLIPGDGGFARDIVLPSSAMATTGTRAQAENSLAADVIVIDADGEDVIVSGILPRDFDEDADVLKVRLRAVHVGGTSISLQATEASRQRGSGAFAQLTDFVAGTKVVIGSDPDGYEIEADLSGLGWKAGDVFAVNFAASDRSSNGVAHVLGGIVTIHGDLVAHDKNSRDERA